MGDGEKAPADTKLRKTAEKGSKTISVEMKIGKPGDKIKIGTEDNEIEEGKESKEPAKDGEEISLKLPLLNKHDEGEPVSLPAEEKKNEKKEDDDEDDDEDDLDDEKKEEKK